MHVLLWAQCVQFPRTVVALGVCGSSSVGLVGIATDHLHQTTPHPTQNKDEHFCNAQVQHTKDI